MHGSGNGAVTNAPVFVAKDVGCDPSDFQGLPKGTIAIILRGNCTHDIKVNNAAKAGASAAVIYNTKKEAAPFIGRSSDSPIPVISVGYWTGLGFVLETGVRLSITTTTSAGSKKTTNVLAETRQGDPHKIIVVGSHLDSVPAGPGINDNGSGSTFNLALAQAVFTHLKSPKHKIRFAWWGAEELGLLGSTFYVDNLKKTNPAGLKDIALNINIDMIGSPNFFYGIYHGQEAPDPIRRQSAAIQALFEQAFASKGARFMLTPFTGRSDYGPFIAVGIPAGGLFSGAEQLKTMNERSYFGGLANCAYDPCYHHQCDTFENINFDAMMVFSRAAAAVVEILSHSVPEMAACARHAPLAPFNAPLFYPSGKHLPALW